MKHQSLGESLLPARRVGGFLLALVCAAALSGCADDDNNPTPATLGSLNVTVNRDSATVVVSGPNNFSKTFTGNQFLADLTPGQFVAKASAAGRAPSSRRTVWRATGGIAVTSDIISAA